MYVQTVNQVSSVSEYAVEKIRAVVEKYIPNPIGVRVKFRNCRHMQKVSVTVRAGSMFSAVASDTADNVYEAIEKVALKIEKQVRRKRGRVLDRSKRHKHLRLIKGGASDDQWAHDENEYEIEGGMLWNR